MFKRRKFVGSVRCVKDTALRVPVNKLVCAIAAAEAATGNRRFEVAIYRPLSENLGPFADVNAKHSIPVKDTVVFWPEGKGPRPPYLVDDVRGQWVYERDATVQQQFEELLQGSEIVRSAEVGAVNPLLGERKCEALLYTAPAYYRARQHLPTLV